MANMKQVFETIEKLRATSSKNDKLAILTAMKDNVDLQNYLLMTYEPRINYYMKAVDTKAGMHQWFSQPEPFNQDLMDSVKNVLAGREYTGNKARDWIAGIWGAMVNPWEKELLELMIQRDVKAGISTGTINKIWPGLITDTPYMRCTLPSETDLSAWPWADGVYSEIKADGQFANISHHVRTGRVSIESRNGSPMPLEYFQALVAEVQARVPGGQQLHGELLIKKDGKILPRQEGNGIFNSLLQGGELEAGHEIVYHVWDTIPVAEAKSKNKYNVLRKKRFALLKEWFDGHEGAIEIIEHKVVYSLQEAFEHAVEAMGQGLEGTVIKHPEGIWEDSDGSKWQVKLKLEFQVELKIKGFKAADKKSKNAKTFGSIECESECGKMKVNVSGIKDKDRLAMHQDRDNLIDKVISVKANGIMLPPANGGFFSLFLPRFIEIRLDKDKADTLERIQQIEQAAKTMGIIYGKTKSK